MNIQVTGEYMVPGKSPERTEQEHFERYKFSSDFVKNKKVLDIACGLGYGCKIYAESGAREILGIDISKSNIEYAQMKYEDKKITFLQGNIYDINYDEEFDIITCFETIEHLQDDTLGLTKLHQALKQNGVLIISTPNRLVTSPGIKTINEKPANQFHYREYRLNEFKDLLQKNGFLIKGVYGQRNRFYAPIPLFNRIIKKVFNPDEKGNTRLKKTYLTQARYYTLLLEKK